MNIFALKGHRVRCVKNSNASTEYIVDTNRSKELLKIGKIYTVEQTYVYNFHTDVRLQELPDYVFNSTYFQDVDHQSPEEDLLHPDKIRYTL